MDPNEINQPSDQQQPDTAIDPQQAQNLLGAVVAGAKAVEASQPPQFKNIAEAIGLGNAMTPGVTSGDVQPPAEQLNAMNPKQRTDAAIGGGAAAMTGGLKSVFETKDFLFGDTPRDQQSAFRESIQSSDEQMKAQRPLIAGLSSGIGQFTVAMMGLGKLGMVAKALPWVGEGVAAVEGIKGGSTALEAGKAALAGAIAFDPHEERLSNLIQDTPLANPFNEWLASKPGDSAAMGRLKNAMESLGMDAAIIGTFSGGLRIWKALKGGDTAAASRAVSQLEAEQRAAMEPQQLDVPRDATEPEFAGFEKVEGDPVQGPVAQSNTEPAPASAPASDSPAVAAPEVARAEGETPSQPSAAAAVEEASPSVSAPVAAADDVPVEIVSNPTAAMEQAGVAKPQAFRNKVDFAPGETATLLDELPYSLENAEKDWDAMEKHGSVTKAISSGKEISPDMGAFYDRLKTDNDLDQMIELAANLKAEELEAQGFRGKLTDAKLQEQVQAYARLSNEDPAGLLGMLQQAGEASRTLTAKMVVVGSYATKAYLDASRLALLRKMGDYTKFGSKEALEQEIAKRFSLATTLLKITDEIRSQGGRTLRANRGRPFDPSLFEDLAKDRLFDLLAETGGSVQTLKQMADPNLYRKIMDTVNYMRISSLVSGPKTQLINIMTNSYMVGVRPLERILGSVAGAAAGNAGSRELIKKNLIQYTYMGNALYDGFGQAVKAFTRNDGLLRPHGHDLQQAAASGTKWQPPGTQAINGAYFRPWDSVGNLLYNALSVPLSAAGVAPRLLGTVDELVKQTVYRSVVAAQAHMDGVEKALQAGLNGKSAKAFTRRYVEDRLEKAFDAEGRGLDAEALREADIATFQQELLPGTYGKLAQDAVSNDPTQTLQLILPFIKTPTNVLRYGWKMTPGLNRLQGEYKQMLSGALGQEAKAQAVGQATMGWLFMGVGAYLGTQGMITGGGPSNPALKAQLLATGWQPYSIVIEHDDGTKTYIPFNRYDPVALPFGIIADILDARHIMGDDADAATTIEDAIGALGLSLAKQFTSRTYLLSLSQALDALSDPDRNGERLVGSIAQSLVPFSGFTRQTSSDPYLRDARTVADKMMQVIPGMSADLPPRYNWLGQPILSRQGLWSEDNGTLVDNEVKRLALEGDTTLNPPSPFIELKGSKLDLRDITMVDGENAYEAYQRLAGKPHPTGKSLRDNISKLMRSKAYENAPDGDRGVPRTKAWLLAGQVTRYRTVAAARVRADKNVREALIAKMRVVPDHYKHLKQPVADEQKAGLKSIMDAFGNRN